MVYKVRCPSPDHNDSSPSFAVYRDGGFCFGCGYRLARDEMEALGIEPERDDHHPSQRRQVERPSLARIQWWHRVLVDGPRRDRLEWFYNRGLSRRTIDDFLFGHDGERFVIPLWYAGELVGIQYRRDRACGGYGPRYQTPRGQPVQTIRPNKDHATGPVIVAEGPLDTALLCQYGYDACSTSGGAGRIPKAVRDEFAHTRRVRLYVATDFDQSGDGAYAGIVRTFPNAKRVRWPAGNDIGEALMLLDPLDRGTALQRWIQDAEVEAWSISAGSMKETTTASMTP